MDFDRGIGAHHIVRNDKEKPADGGGFSVLVWWMASLFTTCWCRRLRRQRLDLGPVPACDRRQQKA
jgi:hypothetical protein